MVTACSPTPETSAPADDTGTALTPGARRTPTPMFSEEYVAALSNILDLEAEDIAALEQRLSDNPDDWTARLKIMSYDARADREALRASRERRARHTLWLIENQPDSEILAGPNGPIPPGQLTEEERTRADNLWEEALAAHNNEARVFWNASRYYRQTDPAAYTQALRRAIALDPANEHYSRELGWLYAGAITQDLRGESAHASIQISSAAARSELETTNNSSLLEAAVHMLRNEYNRSRMLGRPDNRLGDLAQQYFHRAEKLNPGIDRAWVYPHLDPQMEGMLEPNARPPADQQLNFDEADIRRLPIDAFPQLPKAVAEVAKKRGCLVPQTYGDQAGVNVISGEFFAPGQTGWAMLCSVEEHSAIMVFSDASGTTWEDVAPFDDNVFLQGMGDGAIGYLRRISTVNRDYIVRHYRAYGGPEPPPIDHHAINDAFLGKASSIHYRHQGKWLHLQGAD